MSLSTLAHAVIIITGSSRCTSRRKRRVKPKTASGSRYELQMFVIPRPPKIAPDDRRVDQIAIRAHQVRHPRPAALTPRLVSQSHSPNRETKEQLLDYRLLTLPPTDRRPVVLQEVRRRPAMMMMQAVIRHPILDPVSCYTIASHAQVFNQSIIRLSFLSATKYTRFAGRWEDAVKRGILITGARIQKIRSKLIHKQIM